MKSLVHTEELCPRSVSLVHAPEAKSLVCISLNTPCLPHKNCISIVLNFSWDDCDTQAKFKTKVIQLLILAWREGTLLQGVLWEMPNSWERFKFSFYS